MYKQKPLLILLMGLMILSSCGNNDDDSINVNLDEFEPIPEPYPYNNLTTENEVDYLELIYAQDFESETVVFSLGSKCQNSTNPIECNNQFDALVNDVGGFDTGCLPAYCFHYIKYQTANEVGIISNTNALRTFLGNIDSKSDAILLAVSENYNFSTENIETGAIKETANGYQLLMTKMVKFCSPIQTNRFLLEITTDGTIIVLDEEEHSSSNGCI